MWHPFLPPSPYGIFAVRGSVASGVFPSENYDNLTYGGDDADPDTDAVYDKQGKLHVLWNDGAVMRHAVAQDAGILDPGPNESFGASSGSGSLAVGPDDRLHAVYANFAGSILYHQRDTSGWGGDEQVGKGKRPVVAVDPAGVVYVAYLDAQGNAHVAQRRGVGDWDELDSFPAYSEAGQFPERVALVAAGNNVLHVGLATCYGAGACGATGSNGFVAYLPFCPGFEGTTCTPQCNGKVCGPDGCGGTCGTCPSGQSCTAAGQCQGGCTPSCAGKQCGGDGCGGSCGTCASGQTCTAQGQCTGGDTFTCKGPYEPSAASCGAVSDVGCCDQSGRVLYCMSGSLYCIDCVTSNPSCGWHADASYYDCGTTGTADPSGMNPKTCP